MKQSHGHNKRDCFPSAPSRDRNLSDQAPVPLFPAGDRASLAMTN